MVSFKKMSFLAISAILIISLASFSAEKYFTLRFTEEALNKHFQNLSVIKQIAEKSNMAHQEVVFITSSVDSLQKEIIAQVKTQQEPAPKK
jgi:hypothetical protein